MSVKKWLGPAAALLVFVAAGQAPPGFDESASEMRPLLERFTADRGNLQRFYNLEASEERRQRLEKFYADWLARLPQLSFDSMSQDGKIDYIVFRRSLDHEHQALIINAKEDEAAKPYVPFAALIVNLEVCRQQMQPLNSREAAEQLAKLTREIEEARKAIEAQLKSSNGAEAVRLRKIHAARAVITANTLRNTLRTWFTFYDGYDPSFTWWAAEDYRKADAALQSYTAFLRERVLGLRPVPAAPGQAASARGGPEGATAQAGSGQFGEQARARARPQRSLFRRRCDGCPAR